MKLILINGPCGVGKSTVAGRLWDMYEEADEVAVLVGIDELRRMVGLRHKYPLVVSQLALRFAACMIEQVLRDGRDVIVEKMLYNVLEFGDIANTVDVYREIGEKYGADIYEIILWADKETVINRANQRGYTPGSTFTPAKVEKFWHCIDDFKSTRKDAHVLNIQNNSADEVFAKVKDIIG